MTRSVLWFFLLLAAPCIFRFYSWTPSIDLSTPSPWGESCHVLTLSDYLKHTRCSAVAAVLWQSGRPSTKIFWNCKYSEYSGQIRKRLSLTAYKSWKAQKKKLSAEDLAKLEMAKQYQVCKICGHCADAYSYAGSLMSETSSFDQKHRKSADGLSSSVNDLCSAGSQPAVSFPANLSRSTQWSNRDENSVLYYLSSAKTLFSSIDRMVDEGAPYSLIGKIEIWVYKKRLDNGESSYASIPSEPDNCSFKQCGAGNHASWRRSILFFSSMHLPIIILLSQSAM